VTRLARAALAVVALASVFTACGSGGWTRAACAPARPHGSGFVNLRLTSKGAPRAAILYVPKGYDGDRQYPLVLTWHGYGAGAEVQIHDAAMLRLADDKDFLLLAPQGTGNPARFNLERGITSNVDDVGFALDLLDTVQREYCVDAARVYSMGASNGAGMSALLACRAPDRIAAAGLVSLLLIDDGCETPGTPVLAIQGDADLIVPIKGGQVSCCGGWDIAPAAKTMADWAAHDGCRGAGDTKQISDHVKRTIWDACDNDLEVRYYVVHGGGHTWPGTESDGPLGHTTGELDASKEMWRFFSRFSREPAGR
jgi:polyhydroxybutyrate depolymerase